MNSSLTALQALRRELDRCDTIASVERAAAAFAAEALTAGASIQDTGIVPVKHAANGHSSPLTVLPLSDGFELRLEPDLPLVDEQQAVAEIMAGLISATLARVTAVSPSAAQFRLIEHANDVVTSAKDLNQLFQMLAEEFAPAFPGLQVQILLLDTAEKRLDLALALGEEISEAVLPHRLMQPVLAAILEKGQTIFSEEFSAAQLSPTVRQALPQALIPIKIGNVIEGVLGVRTIDKKTPDVRDVSALEKMAAQLGVAISYYRLRARLQQHDQRVETISAITESARFLKPLEPTLAEIQEQLAAAFNAITVHTGLYNPATRTVEFTSSLINEVRLPVDTISVDHPNSLVAWVIRNDKPFATTDWSAAEDLPVSGLIRDVPRRSVICFPMRVRDEVVGAICIQSPQPNQWDAFDYHLMTAITSHIAVIVRNARLFESTRRQVQMAAALHDAATIISTALGLDEVLHSLLDSLTPILSYDNASIALLNENGTFSLAASRGFKNDVPTQLEVAETLVESKVIQEIVRTRETITIQDVRADSRWIVMNSSVRARSFIGAPLLAADEVLGVLMVDSEEVGAYSDEAHWLVSTLASHASVAVRNARLHEELQRRVVELTRMYEANAAMTSELDQHSVYDNIVESIAEALEVDSSMLMLWNTNAKSLKVEAFSRPQSGGLDARMSDDQTRFFEENGIVRLIYDAATLQIRHLKDSSDELESELFNVLGEETLMFAPLVFHSEPIGLLILGQNNARQFSESELRLANSLTNQAVVALDHARLYGQPRKRLEELAAFQKIALQITSRLDLNVVLETISESALKLLEINNLHIYLYDHDIDEFIFGTALWRDGRRQPAVSKPRKNGLTATVAKTGRPIVINDAQNHQLFQSAVATGWGLSAIAGFPIKHNERVLGVFTVAYLESHTFSNGELLLLNLLAEQASVAIQNAQMFKDLQLQLRSSEALVEMAQQVTRRLSLQPVMQAAVDVMPQLLSARSCTIAVLDENELVIEAATGIRPEFLKARLDLDEAVSGRAIRERRSIYIKDTLAEPNFKFLDRSIRSLLVVPLASRDEIFGTLSVDSTEVNAFTRQDIQFLTIAASQVGVAMANAKLYEQMTQHAQHLEIALEELREQDRLKDELVQNVSHELRTPLTFVKGYVDLLMAGDMGAVGDEMREALQIVSNKTNVITRLIDDMVTLQRIEKENLVRKEVDIIPIVEEVIDCHRLPATEQHIELAMEVPETAVIVKIDEERINQVLDNLIANARKFSPDGGSVTVRVIPREHDVLFEVDDQGIGVPNEKVHRIFDRFYQVDGSSRRRFGGTGIGLALVKRIVEAHDGKVWVHSKEDVKGSTFFFTLPTV